VAPHLSIVAPIPPASFGSSPSSSRLHRFERLACDQFTTKGGCEYEENIRCQMRQVVVPRFILAPTSGNLSTQDGKSFLGRFAPGITHGQAITLARESGHLSLELVDLSAHASLPAIKRASVHETASPNLLAIE